MNSRLRYELKYYINYNTYIVLKKLLSSFMTIDKNANNSNTYHIRSLYFDDYSNSAYYEKINGIFKRKKYRFRIYNLSSNNIMLECKEKIGDVTKKDSLQISNLIYKDIISDNISNIPNDDNSLLSSFLYDYHTLSLSPVVIVDYIREPYTFSAGDVRITFDMNLETSINSCDLFDSNQFLTKVFDKDILILEVKYTNFLPRFISDLLNEIVAERCAVSKYVLCRNHLNSYSWKESFL